MLGLIASAVLSASWISDFAVATNLSVTTHKPLVCEFGSPSCPHCQTLKNQFTSPEFLAWQEESGYLFYKEESGSKTPGKTLAADCNGNKLRDLPLVLLFPGDLSRATNFTARSGKMISTKGTLIQQFMNSADEYFARFRKAFVVPENPADRLEAVELGGTGFVEVPLTRAGTDCSIAETDSLEVIIGANTNQYSVAWEATEATKSVRVELPKDLSAGEKVVLLLRGADGAVLAESSIAVVAKPANSVLNPSWASEDFAVGAWTLNYAAATNAVATGAAEKMLVLFDGTLWCPYCKGMEASLLASAEFPQWAKSHRLALMQFDQGRASSPATAAGTRAPRLVTYEPDPNTSGAATVSGAGYVSRNGVAADEADRMIDLTTFYTQKFLAPGSTSARMSQPSFLLVKNEKVVGRFVAWRDANRNYDPVENLGRLTDLLALWDRDDETADYRATTTRAHELGGSDGVSFQISDRNEYFNVSGARAGNVSFNVTSATPGRDVIVRLYADGEAVAEGTNRLETVLSARLLARNLQLGLSAYPDTSVRFFADRGWATTCFDATLTSSLDLVPGTVGFRDQALQVFKQVGSNEVVVCRTDGCSGAVSFRIEVGEGSAENGVRYSWDEAKVYSWADGEFDPISIWFEMDQTRPYETNEFVRLNAVKVSGEAACSADPLLVTLCDTDDPVTPKTDYRFSLYSGFEAVTDELLEVYNLKGGRVTLKRVSGSLPTGVKLTYDKDTGSLVLSGTPKKVQDTTAVYVIVETTGSGRSAQTVTGPEITFKFEVNDPADVNPYLAEAFTMTVPVFRSTGSTNELAGVITLTTKSKNALSLKYQCTVSTKTTSVSGKWETFADGTVSATLSKAETDFDIRLSPEGVVQIDVADARFPGEDLFTGEMTVLREDERLACAGLYTLALVGPRGIGYLTLDMAKASKAKKGNMSFSGALPNGQTVSGSTYISGLDDDFVLLPIYVHNSKYTLSLPLKLRRNAAAAATEASRRAIVNLDGSVATWQMTGVQGDDVTVYGSFYDSAVDLAGYFGLNTARLSLEPFDQADVLGDCAPLLLEGSKFTFLFRESGLSLKYDKKKGKVSGSTRVTVDDRKVSGKFAGVILPGWDECGGCGLETDPLIPALLQGLPVVIGQLTSSRVNGMMEILPDETVLKEARLTASVSSRAGAYYGIAVNDEFVSEEKTFSYSLGEKIAVGAMSEKDDFAVSTELGFAPLARGEEIEPIAVEVPIGTARTISLSGVSGLRYRNGFITGAASKAGVFTAKLKAVSANGITLTFEIPVVVE